MCVCVCSVRWEHWALRLLETKWSREMNSGSGSVLLGVDQSTMSNTIQLARESRKLKPRQRPTHAWITYTEHRASTFTKSKHFSLIFKISLRSRCQLQLSVRHVWQKAGGGGGGWTIPNLKRKCVLNTHLWALRCTYMLEFYILKRFHSIPRWISYLDSSYGKQIKPLPFTKLEVLTAAAARAR